MTAAPIKTGAKKPDTEIKKQMLSFVCNKERFAEKPIASIKSIIPIHPVMLARISNILYSFKSFLLPVHICRNWCIITTNYHNFTPIVTDMSRGWLL